MSIWRILYIIAGLIWVGEKLWLLCLSPDTKKYSGWARLFFFIAILLLSPFWGIIWWVGLGVEMAKACSL